MSAYKTLIVAASLVFASSAMAAVYKSIDADGNVVYTDEPGGNAKPVDLPPLSTVPPPPSLTRPATTKQTNDSGGAYGELSIQSPAADATVRDNTGDVPVSIALTPELNISAGHRVQYYLNGQTEGKPTTSLKTVYKNIDRGTHTVEAAIVDGTGKELKRSAGVRFHLHRQSVNFPRGPGSPTPFAR